MRQEQTRSVSSSTVSPAFNPTPQKNRKKGRKRESFTVHLKWSHLGHQHFVGVASTHFYISVRKLGPSKLRKCGRVVQPASRQAESRASSCSSSATWTWCLAVNLAGPCQQQARPCQQQTGFHHQHRPLLALPCGPVWSLVDITPYLVNIVPIGATASSSWDGAPVGPSCRHVGGRAEFRHFVASPGQSHEFGNPQAEGGEQSCTQLQASPLPQHIKGGWCG